MVDLAATLHHADSDLEIHKLVVGPVDNNVFVLRCRHTAPGSDEVPCDVNDFADIQP